MHCHIIKDKRSGEEYLIPDCYSVIQHTYLDISDRQLIKEYCTCIRKKREKYVTKTRDDVFGIIKKLKDEIAKLDSQIEKLKEELSILESEIFMLNTIEVE